MKELTRMLLTPFVWIQYRMHQTFASVLCFYSGHMWVINIKKDNTKIYMCSKCDRVCGFLD